MKDLVYKKNPESFAPILAQIMIFFKNFHKEPCNMCHLDVKPENILRDERNNIAVIDLGLAEIGDKRTGETKGTPYYVAPEMLLTETGYGKESDIWGIGVLVYIALAGVLPFYGNTNQEIYQMIVSGTFHKWPRDSNIPDAAKQFIVSCLRTDKRRRLTAEQLCNNSYIAQHVADFERRLAEEERGGADDEKSGTDDSIRSQGDDMDSRSGRSTSPIMAQMATRVVEAQNSAVETEEHHTAQTLSRSKSNQFRVKLDLANIYKKLKKEPSLIEVDNDVPRGAAVATSGSDTSATIDSDVSSVKLLAPPEDADDGPDVDLRMELTLADGSTKEVVVSRSKWAKCCIAFVDCWKRSLECVTSPCRRQAGASPAHMSDADVEAICQNVTSEG